MMGLDNIFSSYSLSNKLITYTIPMVLGILNKIFNITKFDVYIHTHKINVDFESSKKHPTSLNSVIFKVLYDVLIFYILYNVLTNALLLGFRR